MKRMITVIALLAMAGATGCASSHDRMSRTTTTSRESVTVPANPTVTEQRTIETHTMP